MGMRSLQIVACCLAAVAMASCGSKKHDPCAGITCSGHGECVVVDGEATCNCDDDGYVADGLMCEDEGTDLPTTNQVVQWGVAWTFDDQYTYGRYANGDYWVLGPVTVTETLPRFAGGHHGWEVNPSSTVDQGFDHRIADFDEDLVPALPYVAVPGRSIVKGISIEPLGGDCRPCMRTAAVLTVVDEVPPDRGATVFRPPYFGDDKVMYSTDDLDTSLLPSLTPSEGAPTLDDAEDDFVRVQMDHKVNWTGRPLHPSDAMPDYGSDIASRNAAGALRMMLDDPIDERMDLIVYYVQMGIDLYHMAQGGTTWPPGGGHGEGRKLPVVMAAVLLGDVQMRDWVSTSDREAFGENGGMYHSDIADAVLFGQTPNSEEDYWENLVFDTGSRTIIDPYRWIDGGHRPGGSYQYCCTAMCWKATATALLLMPELQPVFNNDQFLAYVDRWVTFGAWTQPDPCAPPTGVCSGGDNGGAPCTLASEPEVCTGDGGACDTTGSWDDGYGVTYGPDGMGGCILDTDDMDGIGRAPLLHGVSTDEGHHGSGFAEDMWDAHVE